VDKELLSVQENVISSFSRSKNNDGKYLSTTTITLDNHLRVEMVNRNKGRFMLFSKHYNGYISRELFVKLKFGFVSKNRERNVVLGIERKCYVSYPGDQLLKI
jgi:hypothetical protein